MPDRDPALEAARQDHARKMAANGISWSDSGAVEFGWHAAFRSLGCATPEAQAALDVLHAVNVKAMHEDCACSDCRRARLYLDARYGPAAGAAPTPEPVESPASHPGIADVVALHQAGNAPHLCDRQETLAFLRDVAMENQYLGSARRFLDATREAE